VAPCSLAVNDVSEECTASSFSAGKVTVKKQRETRSLLGLHFDPEDIRGTCLRNVYEVILDYTESRPVTTAQRSKAYTVFARTEAGIVDSDLFPVRYKMNSYILF
jgi:hypothetical protein